MKITISIKLEDSNANESTLVSEILNSELLALENVLQVKDSLNNVFFSMREDCIDKLLNSAEVPYTNIKQEVEA